MSTKRLKTLGIIGGLGHETTARFYLGVISKCQEIYKIRRPSILLLNIPISFYAEENEIINGIYIDEVPKILIDAAKRLEKSGRRFYCTTL